LLGLGLAGVKGFQYLTEKPQEGSQEESREEVVESQQRTNFVFRGKLHKNTGKLFAWLPWQEERKLLLSRYSSSPRETITKVMAATQDPNVRDLFATKRGMDYKLRMLVDLNIHYLPWKEQRSLDDVQEVDKRLAGLGALHRDLPSVVHGGVAWALSNEYELVGKQLYAASTSEKNENRKQLLRRRALAVFHLALGLRHRYLDAEQADDFSRARSTKGLREALRGLGVKIEEPDLLYSELPRPRNMFEDVFFTNNPLEQRLRALTDLHRKEFFTFDAKAFAKGVQKPVEILPQFGWEDELQRLEKLFEVHGNNYANRQFGKNAFVVYASAYRRLAEYFHQAAGKIEQKLALFPRKPEIFGQEQQRAAKLRLLGQKMLDLAARLEGLAPVEKEHGEH
ncbi:hypothetical protein HY571_02220, partial [Candidatus Micrarchaeota archaeon]|nr:hypothetical protein [Candidatus Micrarchaeota archaeon]